MKRWRDSSWAEKMTVRLDYNNMMADFAGSERGFTLRELEEIGPAASRVADDIEAGQESGELGFYRLPYDTEAADRVLDVARSFKGRCDDFVVLGIGGSALGISALFSALRHPYHNMLTKKARGGRPRVFVMDNVDPAVFSAMLDTIKPEKAVFNVITKSGGTAETLSQYLIIRKMLEDRLGKKTAAGRIVVTTGPEKERLNALAQQEGYPLLTIPRNVGGRFSVLTPVGLFPAAMFGVDVPELLAGARHMDAVCRSAELLKNPAFTAGALHYLAAVKRNMNMAVMMPYADSLIKVAYWFRQLWAESLGKAVDKSGKTVNVGQTPVVASGATDQHSQLQLYQEGPYDKVVTFLTVAGAGAQVPIPPLPGSDEMAYLGGHDMAELLLVEARATQHALTAAGRLNMSLEIPEINAFTIGQIFHLLEVETVFTGGLYGIDPLDQPGVEHSKQYINGMMGRKGYEDKAEESRKWLQADRPYII